MAQGGHDESQADELAGMAVRDISLFSGNLMLGLGAKYHASPSLKFGLALQLPSIDLHSEGKLLFVRDRLVADCIGDDCLEDPQLVSNGLERDP